MKTTIAALALALALPLHAQPQPCPSDRISLMVLGTFHMAGSKEDAVKNYQDMTTPQRQKEIETLVDQLAAWKPTKIAIESARNSTVWNDRYKQWLAGTYQLGENEIEQVGFRLSRKLNLPELTPVDYPMWMNGLTPIERHTPKPKPAAAPAPASAPDDGISKAVAAQVAADNQRLASSTLSQYLAYINSPERAAVNHQWDVISNLEPGDGVALYENADLVTNWYKRNVRIVTNVLETSAPGDRVLLLIGVGHKKILGDFVNIHPRFCITEPAAVLK